MGPDGLAAQWNRAALPAPPGLALNSPMPGKKGRAVTAPLGLQYSPQLQMQGKACRHALTSLSCPPVDSAPAISVLPFDVTLSCRVTPFPIE